MIHYCPWLAQYSNDVINSLEVPGQYSGLKKPNPDNHITIATFKSNVTFFSLFYFQDILNIISLIQVQVMYSMRNPIKVTMVGNDGEKYSFLVKIGEDLRQDERILQLIELIKNTLCDNAYCCERQLSLSTYMVKYFILFFKVS